MLIEPPDEPVSPAAPPVPDDGGGSHAWTATDLADGVVAVTVVVVEQAVRTARLAALLARPLTALAWVPLALGRQLRAVSWVDDLVSRGADARHEGARRAHEAARRVAPRVVEPALDLVDLNSVVREHVDVDAIVAGVDVQGIVERVDIDAIVAGVDLQQIIERIDIDAIVAGVDLQRIIERIDIDAIVAGVDLQQIVDRIDVDGIVERVDVDAVIAKLDLVALAELVVEGIDLPGIIRSSTGSMASEGVREVRRQGIGADERVAHVVDRLLHRPERAPGPVFEEEDGTPPTRPQIRRDWGGPDPGTPGLAP
ncbi:hypothetical protein [Intrasporangium flavum]|uniref:hypothetical protein n=1 Tax=Intrasporangium flavum TaxID=1428657 RepID=UPI00096D1B0A|nr:hypothetical protein [Intrasporangium flavum]